MRTKTYLKNAALLTASGLALRALGMVFRVYLAGQLGGEGMGLYQLILSLYMVFVSLATAGINVASTRLAAENLARGWGIGRTVRRLSVTAAVLGTAAMMGQTALAGVLSRAVLHDARAELALRILAPSLPFMAVAGSLRGCFLAGRKVQPNVTAQMVEQLLRMGVVFVTLRRFVGWGAGYGCAAALAGNTVSEAVSCLIMVGYARRDKALRTPAARRGSGYAKRELLGILLPVEGGRMLASGLQAAESALIPLCLGQYLGARALAVAQYGALKGMAELLLFFPFSVLAALSGLLMPEITRARTRKDAAAAARLIDRMMTASGLFSALAAVLFLLFGRPAALLLYRDETVGAYVQILGAAAPFLYTESLVDGVLRGLGEQWATFRFSVEDSVLRIAGILLLLPRWGMGAFLGIMLASNAMTCALNTARMLRCTGAPAHWGRWVLAPLGFACLGGGGGWALLCWLTAETAAPAPLRLALALALVLGVYGGLALRCKMVRSLTG